MKDFVIRDTHIKLYQLCRRYKSGASTKLLFVDDGIKPMFWKKISLFEISTEIIYPIDCDVNETLSKLLSRKEILSLPDAVKLKEVACGNYFIIKNNDIFYIGKSSNVYQRAFQQLNSLGGDSVKIIINDDYHANESKYTYVMFDDVDKFKSTDHTWLRDIIRSRVIIQLELDKESGVDVIYFYNTYLIGRDPIVAHTLLGRKPIKRSELHNHQNLNVPYGWSMLSDKDSEHINKIEEAHYKRLWEETNNNH